MKATFISLFILILFFEYSESRTYVSLSPNVFDTFTNKTAQITNYVREKGRSIRNFYFQNVHNKITSYFDGNKDITKIDEDNKQLRIEREFNNYLQEVEVSDNMIIDTIVPEESIYKRPEDPVNQMTTPQLLALNGYPAEAHTIITRDGYILTIHRIPFSKNASTKTPPRKTVLLHHGLLGSSADWVLAGPEKSLGYILSEAGYDVWLANARGNTYSRAHISRHIDSFAFWNFTFHEISQNDLPAVIDYIMEVKGLDIKINYIGYSMGTTVLFALLSTQTEYNKVLKAGFALAPVAYMTDIRSPMRLLARFSDNFEYLMKLLGANEFLPQNAVLRWLAKYACENNYFEEVICENLLFVICGFDDKQFNKPLLPMILGHVPAGTSTKTLIHYAQEVRNDGKFQQFDYGPEGNIRQYGTVYPPEYPLHKITLPIALFSGKNDWLASANDVNNLYFQLANPIEHYIVPLKEFNHVDFLWAIDADILVYPKLLQLLEKGVSNPYIYY